MIAEAEGPQGAPPQLAYAPGAPVEVTVSGDERHARMIGLCLPRSDDVRT